MIKKFFIITLVCCFVVPSLFAQDVGTSVVEEVDPFEQAVENSKSADPYTRRIAAEQFGRLQDPRAVEHLKRLLKDENSFVRQEAVLSLGLLRTQEAVNEIIDVLEKDKDAQVRQSAVVALGYIGDKKVVPVLTKILKSEEESLAVKYSICNTLSILRSTEAIPVLVELKNSDDKNLRRSVIFALGKIPHSDSIKALREAIDQNLDDEVIVSDIIRNLVDMDDEESIEKFKILYSSPVTLPKMKFYSAYALAKLKNDKSVLPTIKKELASKDDVIRQLAVDAIRFIGDIESLSILKKMKETEPSVAIKQLIDIAIRQLEAKYPKIEQKPTKTGK